MVDLSFDNDEESDEGKFDKNFLSSISNSRKAKS
jgi:hypothetical protein